MLVVAALAPERGGPGWSLLDRFLSTLAQFVVTGALTYGVLESLRGGRASIGALFGIGFRKLGTVFVVSFRVALWLALGTILLVVPAILWYCALFVAVPAAVVEARLGSSADALQRSRELTRGNRWSVFVVALVVFVVTMGLVGVAGAFAAFARGFPEPVPVVLATAVIALTSALGASASAVAYHDLRLAKEGIDTADLVKVFE